MSDDQQMEEVIEEVAVEEVEEEVPLDPTTALYQVLQTSLHHDGLARGFHEAVKALDRREAQLCILAGNCEEKEYVRLINALCKEHSIPLVKVEERETIGEWAGLCKRAPDGRARKVRPASCVVIRAWGEDTPAKQYVMEHLMTNK
jgi:small subunit ribosomal protein S12e